MKTHLVTETNLASPDAFYEALIDIHQGLDDAQSADVNARLILLLANHIGDMAVIREAFELATAGVQRQPVAPAGSD
ncbi:MAG: DUF2783 domain-containing protein [Burkholderiaceae bacterium]